MTQKLENLDDYAMLVKTWMAVLQVKPEYKPDIPDHFHVVTDLGNGMEAIHKNYIIELLANPNTCEVIKRLSDIYESIRSLSQYIKDEDLKSEQNRKEWDYKFKTAEAVQTAVYEERMRFYDKQKKEYKRRAKLWRYLGFGVFGIGILLCMRGCNFN